MSIITIKAISLADLQAAKMADLDAASMQTVRQWFIDNYGPNNSVLVLSGDINEAEARTLAFLAQYVPAGKSPMCGNSICQDRRFLARCMPQLEAYFHYRNLDVSTLKELARRWYPGQLKSFNKSSAHLALQDIRDSIEELRFYRQQIFVPAANPSA